MVTPLILILELRNLVLSSLGFDAKVGRQKRHLKVVDDFCHQGAYSRVQ